MSRRAALAARDAELRRRAAERSRRRHHRKRGDLARTMVKCPRCLKGTIYTGEGPEKCPRCSRPAA